MTSTSAYQQGTALAVTDRPITAFIYLQILDLMTTLAFLANGVSEGNPIMQFFMQTTTNPLLGLVVAKWISVGLGICAWKTGRHWALRKANVFFAALVVWNLVAVIAGAHR